MTQEQRQKLIECIFILNGTDSKIKIDNKTTNEDEILNVLIDECLKSYEDYFFYVNEVERLKEIIASLS